METLSPRARLGVVLFAFLFSLGCTVTSLAPLVQRAVGGDAADASVATGLLIAVQNALEFFAKPLFGQLSDRAGRRKPFMVLSLCGSACGFLLESFGTPALLLAGFLASGATGAFVELAYAYLGDLSASAAREAERERGGASPAGEGYREGQLSGEYALVGICFGAGFVVGPAIGGALGARSLRLPFVAAAVTVAAAAAFAARFLPEPAQARPTLHDAKRDGAARAPLSLRDASPFRPLALLFRSTPVSFLTACFFLVSLAQGSYNVWILFATERLGWDQPRHGAFLACFGLASCLALGLLLRRATGALGERRALLAALALCALRWLLLGLVGRTWHAYLALAVSLPSLMDLTLLRSLQAGLYEAREQGALNGALGSLGTISRVLGPPLAGKLFAAAKGTPAPLGLPFFASSAAALGALACAASALRAWPQAAPRGARDPAAEAEAAEGGSPLLGPGPASDWDLDTSRL
eukprot:tig00000989_g6103.t1